MLDKVTLRFDFTVQAQFVSFCLTGLEMENVIKKFAHQALLLEPTILNYVMNETHRN